MAASKIAALRAASNNAPAAPSGPQALSYPAGIPSAPTETMIGR